MIAAAVAHVGFQALLFPRTANRKLGIVWPATPLRRWTTTCEDDGRWAEVLGLPPDQVIEFTRIAGALGAQPTEILRMMVERVIRTDGELRKHGLSGIGWWAKGHDSREPAANVGLGEKERKAVEGLPLDVRLSEFM